MREKEWHIAKGHKKYRVRYHLILVTKYRKKCLEGIEDELKKSLKECESKSDLKILEVGIDKDHLHMLVTFSPNYSISQTIKRIKQFTTLYLYRNIPAHLRKYYWGKKMRLWSDSYFISSVGEISEQKAMDYIKKQGSQSFHPNS